MKPDEILIAKTAPGLTAEPRWWRFCVKTDGRFEYENSWWSEKSGENTEINKGRLNSKTLSRIEDIIATLDDVELEGMIVEDAGSYTIDYRRSDDTTGSVEQHCEPLADDEQHNAFDAAWMAIKKITAESLA